HREVVDNGRSGFLVSDPSDWLESLSKLIEDNSLRKSFATHSLKHADGFTWNRNASCLMSVTQKALKEACASGKRQPKAARIRKLPPYYIWKAREIIRKYGWIVLVKESMGWIRRRIIR
ncbi:hypothetical protein JW979_08500, partial [bacterium]|nr:hypothetical protein [candidate division CSSED10-310 bacterium]